jgi:hypothetical protein
VCKQRELLALLVIVTLVAGFALWRRPAVRPERATPILLSSDLPGFYFHGLNFDIDSLEHADPEFARTLRDTTEVTTWSEMWLTVTREDSEAERRGTIPSRPYLYLTVGREKYASPQDALLSLQVSISRTAAWKEGSPGGRRIGDQSWYLKPQEQHDNSVGADVKFVKGSIAVDFKAHGAPALPFDPKVAQRLLETIESRL